MTTTVQYVSTSPNDLLVPPNDIISLTGGDWYSDGREFRIDHNQDIGALFPVAGSQNSRFFELYDTNLNSLTSPRYGFEFRYFLESGLTKTKMYIKTSDNDWIMYINRNAMPQAGFYPYDNSDSNDFSQFFIVPGDIVRGYRAADDNFKFQFVVTDEMLFRYLHYADPEEPATGTEGDSVDPPENDPPPTPVFVPRSSRRGNLNFW